MNYRNWFSKERITNNNDFVNFNNKVQAQSPIILCWYLPTAWNYRVSQKNGDQLLRLIAEWKLDHIERLFF